MIRTRTIVVTSQDLDRLRKLIEETRNAGSEDYQYLRDLEMELDQATVVEPSDIPSDVVTMNSTVQVQVEGIRRSQKWTVVYPNTANIDENRISVLAPLGTALLGYRVGDTVEWPVPAGLRRYHIVNIIHQPEAAGEFDQ